MKWIPKEHIGWSPCSVFNVGCELYANRIVLALVRAMLPLGVYWLVIGWQLSFVVLV